MNSDGTRDSIRCSTTLRGVAPRPNPTFDSVDLEALRRRRSEKWARHPPDVLPSFIAELDFPVAPEISVVLVEAVANGGLGYAHARGSGLGEALR